MKRYPVVCPECGETRDVSRVTMLMIKSGNGSTRCRRCGYAAQLKLKKVPKNSKLVYPYQCPICWGMVTRSALKYSSDGKSRVICKDCRAVLNIKTNADKQNAPSYQRCEDCGREFSVEQGVLQRYRKSSNGKTKCKKCKLLDRIKLREGRENRAAELEAERGKLHSEYCNEVYTFTCRTGCLLTRKYGETSAERCGKFTECANKSVCLSEIPAAWDGFSSDYAGFKKHIDPTLQRGSYCVPDLPPANLSIAPLTRPPIYGAAK